MHRLALILVLFAAPHAHAELEPDLKDYLASPFRMAIAGYQRYVSPAKGASCPMTPSDSRYALEAIQRFGLWEGSLLTADRLHRCGHDLRFYSVVSTPDGLKHHDPVPALDIH